MRCLNLIGSAQFCNQAVEAVGEALDVKVERIVVTIGDLRINRGMECGDEPAFGTHARPIPPLRPRNMTGLRSFT